MEVIWHAENMHKKNKEQQETKYTRKMCTNSTRPVNIHIYTAQCLVKEFTSGQIVSLPITPPLRRHWDNTT